MRYENRQAPEGINTSNEHPLKQFAKLLLAAVICVVLLVFVLQVIGGSLAKRIPFKYELSAIESANIDFFPRPASQQMQDYLNELAQRIAVAMPLPENIQIDVHYSDEAVFNAYATIGGNVVFYKGLLEKMPNENALAMVMAHEISHVVHRDPIAGLGGGVVSMLALSMITGQSVSGSAGSQLFKAGSLTGAQFTRRMEIAADNAALSAVYNLYGHVNGADTLFEIMDGVRGDSDAVPDWLESFSATHPLSHDRVQAVRQTAAEQGWSLTGNLTPLPFEFDRWLAAR